MYRINPGINPSWQFTFKYPRKWFNIGMHASNLHIHYREATRGISRRLRRIQLRGWKKRDVTPVCIIINRDHVQASHAVLKLQYAAEHAASTRNFGISIRLAEKWENIFPPEVPPPLHLIKVFFRKGEWDEATSWEMIKESGWNCAIHRGKCKTPNGVCWYTLISQDRKLERDVSSPTHVDPACTITSHMLVSVYVTVCKSNPNLCNTYLPRDEMIMFPESILHGGFAWAEPSCKWPGSTDGQTRVQRSKFAFQLRFDDKESILRIYEYLASIVPIEKLSIRISL